MIFLSWWDCSIGAVQGKSERIKSLAFRIRIGRFGCLDLASLDWFVSLMNKLFSGALYKS